MLIRNKKLLLYIILCLFLVVSVSGEITWSADLYYDDVNKNESFCDITDWTNSGFANVQTGDCHVYQNDDPDTISTINFSNQYEYTTFRFKSSSGLTSMTYQLKSASGATNEFQISADCFGESNWELFVYDYNAAGYVISACDTGVTCDSTVHNVTFYRNETSNDWFAWLDKDYKECSGTSSTTDTFDTIKFECGSSCDGQYIYEMTLYNVTDIAPAGPGGPSNSLNVNILNPIQNYHTNDNTFQINFTYDNADSNNGDCEVFVNNTGYGEYTTTGNESVTLSVNSTVADGGYVLNVTCTDTVNASLSNSDVVDMVVDTVNPVINVYYPLTTPPITQNFNLNISLTDNYLFAYNISIYSPTGILLYTNESINLSVNNYNVLDYVNTTDWLDGVYTINITASDDHTAKDWQPNKVTYISDRLKIDDFISVMPENFDVQNMSYEILSDRIKYSFLPVAGSPEYLTYEVECDDGLYYRDFTGYKGHFVCGDYWLDFENPNNYPVSVEVINNKQAIVTTKAYTFESIGGLNIISEVHNFTYDGDYAYTEFHLYEVFTNNTINTFTINTSTKTDTTTNGTAYLILNQSGLNSISYYPGGVYYNVSDTFDFSLYSNNISFPAYDSQVTVYGFNYSGGNLSNMTGNITYNAVTQQFYVDGNEVVVNVTSGLNYNVYLTSRPDFTIAHSTNNQTKTISSGASSFNFTLFPDQSLFFYAYDIISGVALNNVNLSIFGSTDYDFGSLNGSSFNSGITAGTYNLLAAKTGYSEYNELITITEGGLTNISAFMTSSANDVVFIVQNVYNQLVSGAFVQVTKASDGSLVASSTTDFSGEVKFNLNDLISYKINVSATGYLPFYDNFNVIEDSYVITLQLDQTRSDYYNGFTYAFSPINTGVLVNDSLYNLSFGYNNTGYYSITNCWFTISNHSNILSTTSGYCNDTQGAVVVEFNTSKYDLIIVKSILELNSTTNISFQNVYTVTSYYSGTFSLKNLLSSIGNFNKAGFSGVSRFFMVFMIIAGLTIFMVGKTAVLTNAQGSKVLLFVTALVGFFSYLGWLNVGFTTNLVTQQYFIFVILLFMTIGMIIWEEVGR